MTDADNVAHLHPPGVDFVTAPGLLRGASRILVLGASGAGKSTLARQLGGLLGLPVIHLDQHYHGPGWQEPPREVWDARVAELVGRDRWIIDGNYARSLELRLARADVAIWLDFPRRIYLARALKRVLTHRGEVRPDAAPGCEERFDWAFFKWIWRWPRESRPAVERALAASTVPVVRLASPRELAKLLASLQTREGRR